MTLPTHRFCLLGLPLAGCLMAVAPPAGAGTLTTLYSFQPATEGGQPAAPVIYVGGALWGTNSAYGPAPGGNGGAVFKVPLAGGAAQISAFGGDPGQNTGASLPLGGLVRLHTYLYGTTSEGGAYGGGIAFVILPSGKRVRLHDFGGPGDAALPAASMIAVGTTLYGTASAGGANQRGAVFKISPASGAESVVYSFNHTKTAPSGYEPRGPLIYVNGLLYGTLRYGGAHNNGSVFSLTPGGQETELYAFKKNDDGAYPVSGLTYSNGVFYGTTLNGGTNDNGTVFSLTADGKETLLYSFTGGDDGAVPSGGLTQFGKALYGTTAGGGAGAGGTIFKLKAAGGIETLYTFQGGSDGSSPAATLTAAHDLLYGTAETGGTHKYGTVFSFNP